MFKGKIFWTIVVLILIILIIFVLFLDENSSNISILEGNSDNQCNKLADQFAMENSSTTQNLIFNWTIKKTLLDPETEICYAEFDRNTQVLSEGSDFSEYHIYDLTQGIEIDSLTYYESENYGSVEGEWERYYEQKSPLYFKNREEIFGVEK